jgi:L-aspartate oxidase
MVRKLGIVRDKNRMLEAKEDLRFWCRYALSREFDGRAGWELQNLLTVARLMVASALVRDESRGTHFRSDFPNRDDLRWGLRHVVCEPFVALA